MSDMQQLLKPGRYIVAVSGGVDSIALLHLLAQQPDVHVTVAHFDHGIRSDSAEDRRHVQKVAQDLNLPFVYDEGNLGPGASEAVARKARYAFLETLRDRVGAEAIVTAHHQDDVIETAFLNLLRGTGRKGLTSLKSREGLHRPLLHVSKALLKQYAQANGLVWREDSTNADDTYARNKLRHHVTSKMTRLQRQNLLARMQRMHAVNHEIDTLIANHLHVQPATDRFDRRYFALLPHDVAREVLAAWLRRSGVRDFDRKTLNRVVVAAKTYAPERSIDVVKGARIAVGHKTLALRLAER